MRASSLLKRLPAGLVLMGAALFLSACATSSAMDELSGTTPEGSPFVQQLFKNYSFLANSFSAGGSTDEDGGGLFDDVGGDTGSLQDAFATKALIAAKGVEPDPEPSIDGESASARQRLIAALQEGKDRYPYDAARAQTDYDCWMLNASVASQRGAAASCRASFGNFIAKLERELHPAVTTAPVAAAGPSSDFTVYFDFDSWTLSAEALGVLQQAINTARSGQQTHIAIVGHTDTSGSAGYNQALSLRRANVVKEVLVQMGARPDAIVTTGVGEADLAVQTPDGVKEPKNRRSVITLQP
jgi:outer membrane protein OmpA-like peptidoglycan-associated protein